MKETALFSGKKIEHMIIVRVLSCSHKQDNPLHHKLPDSDFITHAIQMFWICLPVFIGAYLNRIKTRHAENRCPGKGAVLLHLQKDFRADKKQHSVQVRCSKIASMQIFLGESRYQNAVNIHLQHHA